MTKSKTIVAALAALTLATTFTAIGGQAKLARISAITAGASAPDLSPAR